MLLLYIINISIISIINNKVSTY